VTQTPTAEEIVKRAAAEFLDRYAVLHESTFDFVVDLYRRLNKPANGEERRQAEETFTEIFANAWSALPKGHLVDDATIDFWLTEVEAAAVGFRPYEPEPSP
jgi:molybdopterin-biosynthesis enzyme MoeA-like protein